jgi:short-subunit dehydrogenase
MGLNSGATADFLHKIMSVTLAKTVWLIGASAGIGAELATQLHGAGFRLILSARSLEGLQETAARCEHKPLLLPLDVRDKAAVAALTLPFTPDMVIYNAGAYTPMGAKDFDLDKAEAMLETNLTGAFRVVAKILPAFLAQNKGQIVLVGSVAAYGGLPNAIGYGASKAGIYHFAQNLKLDLKDTMIKVQVVSPGFVKTRLTDQNAFTMPFIIEVEEAAARIVAGIASNKFEIAFPTRFVLILKTLALLPHWLYFKFVSRV